MNVAKLLLLIGAAVSAASGATVQLYQGGWAGGGPLTITFSGEDMNADGGYETAELTSFNAVFQFEGGPLATYSLPDLGSDGFFYRSPIDYFIKADGPDFTLYEIANTTTIFGLAGDVLGAYTAATGDPLSAAPEPSSAGLLAISVGMLLASRLRRRRTC